MRRLLLALFAFLALPAPAQAAWVWPVSGDVITPYRNGTDPYAPGQHRGIDIAAPVGAPVVAAAGGDVRFAGTAGSSGLTIGVRTEDGFDTSYLHLSSIAVRAGARVSAGERIGAVGTSGTRSASAPHLHFGMRDAGTRHGYHDPLGFLPPSAPPAAEPPAAAPAPAREPAPPATAPVPAVAPGVRPEPGPGYDPEAVPRRAPSGARVRRRAPRPALRPRTAPRPAGAPRGAPSSLPPARSPHGASPLTHVSRRAPLRPAPWASGQHHAPKAGSVAAAQSPAAPRSLAGPRSPAGRAGPDIGMALACAGLLLAAALLALTGHGHPGGARRRQRLARVLPLLGRR